MKTKTKLQPFTCTPRSPSFACYLFFGDSLCLSLSFQELLQLHHEYLLGSEVKTKVRVVGMDGSTTCMGMHASATATATATATASASARAATTITATQGESESESKSKSGLAESELAVPGVSLHFDPIDVIKRHVESITGTPVARQVLMLASNTWSSPLLNWVSLKDYDDHIRYPSAAAAAAAPSTPSAIPPKIIIKIINITI